MTPEIFDVTQAFIANEFSLEKTAKELGLSIKEVSDLVNKPEAKSFINEVFMDSGYRNRAKLYAIMDKIVDSKLEEAEESGIMSSKDLLEVLQFLHKMKMDEAKLSVPDTQVNIANFGGNAYTEFVDKLVKSK